MLEAMAASRYAIGRAVFVDETEARIEDVVAAACRIGILLCRGGPFPSGYRRGGRPALRPRSGRLEDHGRHAGPAKAVAVDWLRAWWMPTARCRRALWNRFLRDRGHSPPARRQARGIGCCRIVGTTTAEKENKVQSVSLTPTSA